jgi:hypothetical protein
MYKNKIRDSVSELGLDTEVKGFHSKENKEIKIYNAAPSIRNRFIYFPVKNQSDEYKKAMKYRHSYLKMIKNQVDDSVDADSCLANNLIRNNIIENNIIEKQ